jgi:hypothetical protein
MTAVYVGSDSREHEAYAVACASLARRARGLVEIHKLEAGELYRQRLLWRPIERTDNGQMIDHLSGAPQSTEFATARFLVPFLQRRGWALFVDADVVFLEDVAELFALADDRFAVMCVKHCELPQAGIKMDGQAQLPYPRKNWSSVVLWNCDHPAHHRLSLAMVNHWPGELLHRFAWLRDSEIGALPAAWNWLVSVEPKPEIPKIAHFTLGGPWLTGWRGGEYDEVWNAERNAASHHAAVG